MPNWQKIRIGAYAGILVAAGLFWVVSGGHPRELMTRLFGI